MTHFRSSTEYPHYLCGIAHFGRTSMVDDYKRLPSSYSCHRLGKYPTRTPEKRLAIQTAVYAAQLLPLSFSNMNLHLFTDFVHTYPPPSSPHQLCRL